MSHHVLIVGAGRVGRALGSNLTRNGYEVRFAVRTPELASVGIEYAVPVEGAAIGYRRVILAVPFSAVPEAVPLLGLEDGAVLIDATNPFGMKLPPGFASGAAVVASTAGPAVTVVKAFNVLGAEHMESPALPDGRRPVLPVASDDSWALARTVQLATKMGFDALSVGGLSAAATMEEAARYWGLIAVTGGRGRRTVLVADQRPSP
ncbi:NAD(P)-binding domain-containing protein [Arthrobacter sp. Y-9]|uniref:NADPH-dependent F420 reductase n=1 Tax=Arthrobacter sp. Y-9 TaxID=3039385 RepID=UPI00241CB7AC|nr:NAD(P)-binding domain-containing protein [Arthrobacter sp. Y-9]WFR84298.1 NAD(P)-binding domain-containing protein [Arthrobacter sp. Y-9]